MTTAQRSAAQQQFVEDELLRVPMVADQVLDATLLELQGAMAELRPQERAAVADLMQAARSQRARLADRFAHAVREQLAATAGHAAPMALGGSPALSLLDENEVAADVEISRAIEAIEAEAEHELRELATYTAALAGDMDLSNDHNPLSPEVYAQGMWAAAQSLTMGRGYQVLLMRHASAPLAQVLRKSYAGACARLESMGVEPAAYRTLVRHALPRSGRGGTDTMMGVPPDMAMIRDSMPWARDAARTSAMPLDRALEDADRALRSLPRDATPTVAAQLIESHRDRLVRHADSATTQQVIELLSRLFEAMLADSRVARDIRAVLARMQPAALRFVLRRPEALEDYAHPVWRFMDEVAHAAALQPEGSAARDEVLRLAESLTHELSSDPSPDATLYELALSRLAADCQGRLKRRIEFAATDIGALQAIEKRLADSGFGAPTGTGALDASQLDTVPADLLDNLPPPRGDATDASRWLDARKPGDWVRMFVQGRWVRAQLLWLGRRGEVWLFGLGQTSSTVALRRRALERLYAESLMTPLQVRSMLRSAAAKLARQSGPAGG